MTAAIAGVLALASSHSAAAQDQIVDHTAYVDDRGEVVHCVSAENGRTYCGHPHTRYVITGSAASGCVQDKTWGIDDRGVWVSGGCVADFNSLPEQTVARHDGVDNAGTIVHCVSTASGRTYCGKPKLRYVIVEGPNQSATACIAGKTWGHDERGAWVSGGCVADFRLDPDATAVHVEPVDQRVHCAPVDSTRTYCGEPYRHYAIYASSSPACMDDTTWGVDDRGVWVSGACTADFRMYGGY